MAWRADGLFGLRIHVTLALASTVGAGISETIPQQGRCRYHGAAGRADGSDGSTGIALARSLRRRGPMSDRAHFTLSGDVSLTVT